MGVKTNCRLPFCSQNIYNSVTRSPVHSGQKLFLIILNSRTTKLFLKQLCSLFLTLCLAESDGSWKQHWEDGDQIAWLKPHPQVGHALCMHKKGWSFTWSHLPSWLFGGENPLKYVQKFSLKNFMCNLVTTIGFLLFYHLITQLLYGKRIQCWCWIVTNTHILGENQCWKDQQEYFLSFSFSYNRLYFLLALVLPNHQMKSLSVRVPSQLSKIQNEFFPLDVLQQLNFLSVIKTFCSKTEVEGYD